MSKVIVIYNQPTNKEGFEEHYFNVHIPLAEKLPGIKNVTVNRVQQAMNTSEDLYLLVELEFDSVAAIGQALESPAGKEVTGDVENLLPFLQKPPVITIND